MNDNFYLCVFACAHICMSACLHIHIQMDFISGIGKNHSAMYSSDRFINNGSLLPLCRIVYYVREGEQSVCQTVLA